MFENESAMHAYCREEGGAVLFALNSVLVIELGTLKKRGPKLGYEPTWILQRLMIPIRHRSTRKRRTSLPEDSAQSLITAILTAPDTYSVPTSANVVRRMLLDLAKYTRELEKELDTFRREKSIESCSSNTSPPSATLPTEREAPPPRSEIDLDEALGDRLKGLTLKHYRGRHFGNVNVLQWDIMVIKMKNTGQSSHFMLLSTALDMRDDLNGEPQSISVHLKRSEFWDLKPVSSFLQLLIRYLKPCPHSGM